MSYSPREVLVVFLVKYSMFFFSYIIRIVWEVAEYTLRHYYGDKRCPY